MANTFAVYVPSFDHGFGDYLRYPAEGNNGQRQIIGFNSITQALASLRACGFTDSTRADIHRSAYIVTFPNIPKRVAR